MLRMAQNRFEGGRISTNWLEKNFDKLPDDVTDEVIQQSIVRQCNQIRCRSLVACYCYSHRPGGEYRFYVLESSTYIRFYAICRPRDHILRSTKSVGQPGHVGCEGVIDSVRSGGNA
ncbi:hypothetical protein PVK06_001405 [Gossypium arboreum]|uniref:Uncharacterized protein n=1 Tax=Gossypium arboreum TaxID=29729 RepID=A0ABR0R292_GOSAR|nr:hypothetical protein PVK06_001405 [Gossypium arboreum]